jgi:alpha-mannosidase
LVALQVDTEPKSREFRSFSLDPDGLIISALKQAEDGDGIILRFFETRGESCRAALGLPPGITAVRTVNLLEEEEGIVEADEARVEMEVGPFEIVTLKLSRG